MLKASRAHLAFVDETYFEHMRFALFVGGLTIGAGFACILHAVIPAVCQRSCSRAVGSLQRLFADRSQLPAVALENSALLLFVVLMAISTVTAIAAAAYTNAGLVGLIVIPQAFALPLIFLAQNRGLDPDWELQRSPK
jgi:hypothetical protein